MTRRGRIRTAVGTALAGAVGVGVLVLPAGASAAPPLPPVSPEDLVTSVATAQPGPFNGTVSVENNLGLPALPGLPQAANGTSAARVWSEGDGKGRLSLPSSDGEKTFVDDGTTRWAYDSADRTVTKAPEGPDRSGPPKAAGTDPAAMASQAIAKLRTTSTVAVDGTAEVAGRSVYQLVLTPLPTERTLLREVRISVDAEKRLPLQMSVLTQGSGEPALQVGFSDVTFGPQDASLFTFTPPPGSTVTDAPADRRGPDAPGAPTPGAPTPGGPTAGDPAQRPGAPTVVGDGWDTVVVATAPKRDAEPAPDGRPDAGAPDLSTLGTPVSGAWGSGRQISTAVGTAIFTDDGRIAAGAVPAQVLTEALTR